MKLCEFGRQKGSSRHCDPKAALVKGNERQRRCRVGLSLFFLSPFAAHLPKWQPAEQQRLQVTSRCSAANSQRWRHEQPATCRTCPPPTLLQLLDVRASGPSGCLLQTLSYSAPPQSRLILTVKSLFPHASITLSGWLTWLSMVWCASALFLHQGACQRPPLPPFLLSP